MNCHDIQQLLPDLSAPWPAAVGAHLAECPDCARRAEAEQALRARLRDLPGMSVRPDFARRLHGQYTAPATPHWRRIAAPVALAASLLLAVLLIMPGQHTAPDTQVPSVAESTPMQTAEVRTVHLRVDSARDLNDVVIRLELPEGVQLAGFDDQRVVEWTTTVLAGPQLLSLPLKGHSDQPLVATIQHRSGKRRFETLVAPTGRSAGSHPHNPEVHSHA